MLINVLENIVKQWGDETVKLLKQYHIEAGQKASGNAEKEFKDEISTTDKDINLTILGSDYVEFLDRGRGGGKQTPVDVLLAWMKTKGVAQGLSEKGQRGVAFAIARVHAGNTSDPSKVGSWQHRKGTTYKGFANPVSKAVEQSRINALSKLVEDNLIKEVESETLRQFRTGKI